MFDRIRHAGLRWLLFPPSIRELVSEVAQSATDGYLPTATADMRRSMDENREDTIRLQLATRLAVMHALWRHLPPEPAQRQIVPLPHDFPTTLRKLKSLHPHLWERWERINFVDSPAEFSERPEGSCSIGRRGDAASFSGFVAPYLHGDVLDVGCGPYAVPVYLREYPTDCIYGIDPVDPFEPHPFTFVRGFAEFLPFPDRSFDVVIAATSLDHTLALNQALGEIRRVLKPGGRLLAWDGFVKGSPRYEPANPTLELVDKFHFFHFDEGWFEALMGEYGLSVREKLAYDPSTHNPQYCTSFFYCLESTS